MFDLHLLTAVYPKDDWGLVFSTVVTGLVVVFLILALLISVIWLMGKLMNRTSGKTDTAQSVPAPPKEMPVIKPAPAKPRSDSNEVIAVIAAAIAAIGREEGKNLKITGICKREKSPRPNWSRAGIIENTQPKG